MRTDYQEFLHQKRQASKQEGKAVDRGQIHPLLFPFQRDVVVWAVRKGRAAIFLDTGLGKTFVQLEWARLLGQQTLIIAPLSVARQTVREGKKVGCEVRYVRSQGEISADHLIWITNYEMMDGFDFSSFGAVVLDESSILKALDGKTRGRLITSCRDMPYRLACTATPAPNDQTEIGNHAEFLGICTRAEMLSMFFVHANIQRETVLTTGAVLREKFGNARGQEWRLKNHARQPFYRWLASWAMTMRTPSDLGYSDDGFILPPLTIEPVWTDANIQREGELFFTGLRGIGDRQAVRRQTIQDRIRKLATLINGTGEQWIVWTGLQAEADAATEAIRGAVQVKGGDSLEEKARRIEGFQDGEFHVLVTKPRIAGFGLNLQNAHRMAFLGLNDSWESYYQCIRRQWRFGQQHPVKCHIILSTAEREIYENILRKEEGARQMREELLKAVATHERAELAGQPGIESDTPPSRMVQGRNWTAILGDACECLPDLLGDSVDLSVYSPPFADLYTYSPSERDLGNSRGWEQFFEHYGFIIQEILRVTKPGRLSCVHTSDIPAMAVKDGYIGMRDFPGGVIRAHEAAGWIFVGRAFVQKNPQALRNGTNVLTPSGWKAIEALSLGEQVIGSDGKQTEVLGAWPHGRRQMYRVRFSDGVTVDCDAQHQWTVRPYGRKFHTAPDRQWVTLTTAEVAATLRAPGGNPRYDIPRVKPVVFSAQVPLDDLVHPYVLGVLLGDGCVSQRSTVEFMGEPEIAQAVSERLDATSHVLTRAYGQKGGVGRHTIVAGGWHQNPTLTALRTLGIQGQRAWEKHIPEQYKRAMPTERLELLRGLLDTDGTCKKNGQAYFSTVSAQLAQDVVELVQSLGGLAGCTIEQPRYAYNGEVREGRPRHLVTVNIGTVPFRLSRKADRWHQRRETMRRIVAVEPAGESECTCITVANADGLFVTEGYVLTHNSQAIRTKSKALLFVQLRKDSSHSRPAIVDQVLIFRKPGETSVPVRPVENGELDNERWIAWAYGIWTDIHESDVLRYSDARASDDEKHICPLQLGTIQRCIALYSNPGEKVLTPFMGIGSEAYQAVRSGRRAIGIELKESYFNIAVQNLQAAELEGESGSLFATKRNTVSLE